MLCLHLILFSTYQIAFLALKDVVELFAFLILFTFERT